MSNQWTPGPWEAEHRPHSDHSQCGAVVTDANGNELFDSFNRCYKVSLIEQLDDDGKWYDTAGFRDLTLAAAAPLLYDALEEIVSLSDRKTDAWDRARAALAAARGDHA